MPNDVQGKSVERDLLSGIDNAAAVILTLLEKGMAVTQLSERDRTSWSQFVVAQQLRSPEDIVQLKSMIKEEWVRTEEKLQPNYELYRGLNDPPHVSDFIQKQDPHHLELFSQSIAFNLLSHAGIVDLVKNMRWQTISFSKSSSDLLTCDRPVWATSTLMKPDDFLWMPIGPKTLFVAALTEFPIMQIRKKNPNQLAKTINKFIVEHAVKFVFGWGTNHSPLVEKYFANKRHSSLLERLAVHRGLTVVSARSPSALFNPKI